MLQCVTAAIMINPCDCNCKWPSTVQLSDGPVATLWFM